MSIFALHPVLWSYIVFSGRYVTEAFVIARLYYNLHEYNRFCDIHQTELKCGEI